MFRKGFKEIADMTDPLAEVKKGFKKLSSPAEAVQHLQEILDVSHGLDKHLLQDFILYLRQIATDLHFKHYRARCQYILIPPEDSLTFWVTHRLGNCPEGSRFAFFQGEIQELLKDLASAKSVKNKPGYLPSKEIDRAIQIIKDKYPGFLTGLTREPLLIPVLNFRLYSEDALSWPELHCFTLSGTKSGDQETFMAVLRALASIIHYHLTEDLKTLPLGFANLLQKISVDLDEGDRTRADAFAETLTASLLYDTEYMPLIAYMEFDHRQQEEIHRYLTWQQGMCFSGLGANVRKLIDEHQKRLRA